MDRIAQLTPSIRTELFVNASIELDPPRSPAIVEKDFWVCWVLHRIFETLNFRTQLIFKGGTSLSKAYKAIERFSEDVDLSFSRDDLEFGKDRDPEEPGISRKESGRRIDALTDACKRLICDRFLPALHDDFRAVLGEEEWRLDIDDTDPQTIIFTYPESDLVVKLPSLIRPVVRLEMGARSDDWPAELQDIRPYAAEAHPEVFSVAPSCRVRVLHIVRTFWEKATLLHAEYHRAADRMTADRLSRHYYDLYQLFRLPIGAHALERFDILERVVVHKRKFFPAAWARYETAIPGSLHLVPPAARMISLKTDYLRMQEMIFGEAPTWKQIIEGLQELEHRINK